MSDEHHEASPEGRTRESLPVTQAGAVGPYGYSPYPGTYDVAPHPHSAGMSAYLHALRRRWWMALAAGLLCAGLAAPAVWFSQIPQYTATALLRIAAQEPTLLGGAGGSVGQNFDLYKNTQSQLLKTDFVLMAALRKLSEQKNDGGQAERETAAAALALAAEQPDQVRWLSEEIRTDIPGGGELLRVRMSGDNPKAVAGLVNAVVDAYMSEVVTREQSERRTRLDELDRAFNAKDVEVRAAQKTLNDLAAQLGTGDSNALSVQQQFLMQQLGEIRGEFLRAGREVRRLENELRVAKAQFAALYPEAVTEVETSPAEDGQPQPQGAAMPATPTPAPPAAEPGQPAAVTPGPAGDSAPQPAEPKRIAPAEILPYELDAMVRSDVTSLQLMARRDALKAVLAEIGQTVRPQLATQYTKNHQAELSVVEGQLTTRRQELATELKLRKQREFESRISNLEMQLDIAKELRAEYERDLAKEGFEVKEAGGNSIDVEMQRAELAQLQASLNSLAKEREQLRTELGWSDRYKRVQILDMAVPPRSADSTRRIQLTALAAMAGLVLPAMGFIFWDVRAKRINSSEQVSEGMGLMVLGTIPVIPVRAIQHGGSLSRRHQHWRGLLNEAINNVIVRLLREAREGPLQVMLITSATSGEGKTTLATHMAMSLARSGRRTLLVDCDLRRPALDRVFNVAQEPGVAELLLGEMEPADVVHETTVDNLYLATAGGYLEEGLEVLTSGAVETLLARLREEYDFIVLDGSPVLPVPDSRILAQHVDAVILSIIRDVTQAPKLQAAWRILTALGARAIGSVVTGTSEEVYYKDMHYANRVPA